MKKLIYNLLPVALFFIAYRLSGIFVATGVAMISSALQLLWSRYETGEFEAIPVIILITFTVLGGTSLLLQNAYFIKLQPTSAFWTLGIAFLVSRYVTKRSLIQRATEETFPDIQLEIQTIYMKHLSKRYKQE